MKPNKLFSSIRRIFTALPWQVGFLSRSTANEDSNSTITTRPVAGSIGSVPRELLENHELNRRMGGTLLVAKALSRQRETWRESKLNRGE